MKDVDAIVAVAADRETVFWEIIRAAVFSGSSFCCVCVETMAAETAAAAEMIPAGSLSYCCFFAETAEEVMAAAADLKWGGGHFLCPFFWGSGEFILV